MAAGADWAGAIGSKVELYPAADVATHLGGLARLRLDQHCAHVEGSLYERGRSLLYPCRNWNIRNNWNISRI